MSDKTPQREASDSRKMLGCVLWVILIAAISACLFLTNCPAQEAKATELNLIARQTRQDDCTLAAVATSLNYVIGGFNYTSPGLQLAYKLKYGRTDWAKDGNTSHQAQALAEDAGFKTEYGKLGDWGGVAALKYLAWARRYPVVFLSGYPQHAVVVLSLEGETLVIADPYAGQSYRETAQNFYDRLDADKWYFTAG